MSFRYLFGPVPSRRLGISLGVDLLPPKVCSMNCVYCECGATTQLTVERAEYVPTRLVIAELDQYLAEHARPDYVTFSGSGEPTLHCGIGTIIDHLKRTHSVPVALLTNSSLMKDPAVQAELLPLDLVLPSLDAASQEVLKKINRPHPSLHHEDIVAGLAQFRRQFSGEIWLEIFILEPFNTTGAEIDLLRQAIGRIAPDRVQLNSLDRPGTESWVKKAPFELLEDLAVRLDHPRVEVISRYRNRGEIHGYRGDIELTILDTAARRPCTLEDFSEILGLPKPELNKYLDILENEKRIQPEIQERGIFYRATR